MFKVIGLIMIGVVAGVVTTIILSVIAISGKMSDQEYQEEIRRGEKK